MYAVPAAREPLTAPHYSYSNRPSGVFRHQQPSFTAEFATHHTSVIHRPSIPLLDHTRTQHRHCRPTTLPVRSIQPPTHQPHFVRIHTPLLQIRYGIPVQQPVENLIGLRVTDSQIPLVRLAPHEIRSRRLLHYLQRNSQVSRQLPHLRLVQVAQRVHRRRVVRMPGEVAHETLRLVAGAQRKGQVTRGQVEQRDHAHARHHVPTPAIISVRLLLQVAVHRGSDVHGTLPYS